MGNAKLDDVAPGWIDVWRLWRHCLCRFGWYPVFVAPLVTCACLLDLYSSTGCDFIRIDIGFTPANDVWSDSHAQLGLFSFDSHQTDKNKWKRSFNNGCRLYSESFQSTFIASDQTWYISRIMAYISGIASVVALATSWLLTITPLPASFFWPGVLLPAVVLSMLTGAAKFIFFNTEICTEMLWFVNDSSWPVAAQSCEIGESSVFGIASVAAYFFCTVLICFRSPQKRELDQNFGKRAEGPGSTVTPNTVADIIANDPEHGHGDSNNTVLAVSGCNNLGIQRRETNFTVHDTKQTLKVKNNAPQAIEHGQHTRSTSDVTWSTACNKHALTHLNERSKNVGALFPPTKSTPHHKNRQDSSPDADWNTYGHPIIVTINDSGHTGEPRGFSKDQSLRYPDVSTAHPSVKSPASRGSHGSSSSELPPRHNGKNTINYHPNNNGARSEYDAGSISSRISKLSITDTHTSDDFSALGMQSYSASFSNKSTPSIVAIPRSARHTFSGASPASSISSGKRLRYAKRGGAREDRNESFLHEQQQQLSRFDGTKRDGILEYLPPLDEVSTTRSLEDHGDLINKCVRDLQMSFGDDGFRTM